MNGQIQKLVLVLRIFDIIWLFVGHNEAEWLHLMCAMSIPINRPISDQSLGINKAKILNGKWLSTD